MMAVARVALATREHGVSGFWVAIGERLDGSPLPSQSGTHGTRPANHVWTIEEIVGLIG
jgi:hypothetical protein